MENFEHSAGNLKKLHDADMWIFLPHEQYNNFGRVSKWISNCQKFSQS